MDQSWHAWIYPGDIESLLPVPHILFTHFHPDHFHPESFPLLNKDAEVIVPVTAGGDLCNRARDAGFARVREIRMEQPIRLGDLEVHALRIHDHWEFLDETAYLIVEDGHAALFLADLWYMPPAMLAAVRDRYRLAFASIPWGGSVENLCVLPEGYRVDSIAEYYEYGMDPITLSRRNSVMEHGGVMSIAAVVDADYMIPGAFGFGWISDDDRFVKPMPVNCWLDQEKFISTLPDPRVRAKMHPMYPGDRFDTARGEMHHYGMTQPNHIVTNEMRARSLAYRDSKLCLHAEKTCQQLVSKINSTIDRLRGASQIYRDQLPRVLMAEQQFEIHIVNDARQMFFFEQKRGQFSARPIERSTGLRDILYMPPKVLRSMVEEWGPKWTDANFSGLVKVSASGWAPYQLFSVLLG